MNTNMPPNICIVGAGNVGSALAVGFSNSDFDVQLISRQPKQAEQKLSIVLNQNGVDLPTGLKITDYPVSKNTSLVIICVPDRAIENICEELSENLCGCEVVTHCSGLLSSSVLKSAKDQGCLTASTHPLNTFPNLDTAITTLSDGHNSYLYCEGDKDALIPIQFAFEKIGFKVETIAAQNKVLYHAACVFVSNYLTVLMDMALQTAESANLDRRAFLDVCKPIVKATLENIDHYSPDKSLSGPLARGDMDTVNQHLQALSAINPDLANAYQVFAEHALKILSRDPT